MHGTKKSRVWQTYCPCPNCTGNWWSAKTKVLERNAATGKKPSRPRPIGRYPRPGDPLGRFRTLQCLDCQGKGHGDCPGSEWETVEVPVDFVENLLLIREFALEVLPQIKAVDEAISEVRAALAR